MNTLKGARSKWSEVFEDPNLSLNSLKKRAISQHSNLGLDGIRSVCWKVYLSCLPSVEISTWPMAINQGREGYVELRKKYIRKVGDDDGSEPDLEVNNPLSLAEDSPWQQFFLDSELRKIIKQDVDRTLPDNDYFRSEKIQEQLNDILFIYCKINHDVSYRQGMHELVAYVLWVVASESIDVDAESSVTSDATTEVIKGVLDSKFVEHDTFALFSALMSRAKPWYEFSDEGANRRAARPNTSIQSAPFGRSEVPEPSPGKQTPVIEWSMRIYFYLERVDNQLYQHLKSMEIQPQLFGIRWFRLLFGREFPMEDALTLWDGIFSQDPSLNICIFIGLALLLRIRDELLEEEDFAGCLQKLMRYPSVKDVHLFIPQALVLQRQPNAAGGMEVTRQNYILSGKPLPALPPQVSDSDQQQQQQQHQQHHRPQYQRDTSPSPLGRQSQQHNPNSPHYHDQTKTHGSIFPNNGVLSQHLPPAALDAIKPVAEGFVHVTKNVLESRGGAALNKAIHDMKKNTQSIMRKTNVPVQSSAASASSFPPIFDQPNVSSSRIVAATQPGQHSPKQENRVSNNNDSQHPDRQLLLGQIVAKALVILESEFTSPPSIGAQEKDTKNPQKATVENPSKAALAAISGLEHVRDILLGFSKDLNPLVIESSMLETPSQPSSPDPDVIPISSEREASPTKIPADTLTTGGAAPTQRKPVNAVTSTNKAGPSGPNRTASPSRTSFDTPSEGRSSISRTSSQNSTTGIGGYDQEHKVDHVKIATTEPLIESYVPSPPPPVPTPKPFSFEDLIEDAAEATSRPPSKSSSKTGRAGTSAPVAKIKSPRSSLAHSQFSWMVNDTTGAASSSASGGLSSRIGGGGSGGGSRSSLDMFGSSTSGGQRMTVDPLAGSISKRTSGTLGTGMSPEAHHQYLHDEDPLRV